MCRPGSWNCVPAALARPRPWTTYGSLRDTIGWQRTAGRRISRRLPNAGAPAPHTPRASVCRGCSAISRPTPATGTRRFADQWRKWDAQWNKPAPDSRTMGSSRENAPAVGMTVATDRMSKLASRSEAGASSELLTIALLGNAQTCNSEVYV